MTDTPIVIGPAEITSRDGISRITADVDGVPVWFETRDVELQANPEVWASAFYVPSLHVRRHLHMGARVDDTWLAGLRKMLPIYHEWWDTPDWLPEVAGTAASESAKPQARTGTFFTCGIDSFHGLLRSGLDVHALVNVQGYDVELSDTGRLAGVDKAVRRVGNALNLQPIIVRTNLRAHPLMIEVNWEHTHGGALAAIGHALRGQLSKVLIASSFPEPYNDPWGSHWQTDSLWSSSTIEFVHVGADSARVDKIRDMAREPVILPHLRVCYEQADSSVNCSRCEKCLFTMLCLAEQGILDDCETFDGSDQLLQRLQALSWMRWRHKGLKRLSESAALDPGLKKAARRLWKRSVWRKSALRRGLHRLALLLGMAREPDLTADQLKDARARAGYRDSE